ncbi:hypothetical protein BC827DRAFT_1248907 [Russula dissimulans]|nr:hypothetical protein BC827DRAFT_1248907 [Russula dissimulans]
MEQEAERLSSQANILSLLLKVETERAEKYHNILLQLAGGDNATGVSQFPGGASICLTVGAPLEQVIARPSAEQGGVDRNNEPETEGSATASVAAQSPVVPSISSTRLGLGKNDRLATSAGGSSSGSQLRVGVPTTAGGRRSVSHGRSARSSMRMLLHSSSNILRPTLTVNGPMRPRRTGGQNSQQRTVPTPSPFVLTGTGELESFISAVEVLTRASLGPFRLTRAEVIRSEETPGITWDDFSRVFGVGRRVEWAECRRFPGYKTFLCADHRAQPYLPTGTGKPGLILRPPTGSCMHENDNVAIQVLSCSPQDDLLYYQGQYTRDRLHQIRVSFCDLPAAVRCRKPVNVQKVFLSMTSCSAGKLGYCACPMDGNAPMLLSVHVSSYEMNSAESPQLPRSRNIFYTTQQHRQLVRWLLLHFKLVKRKCYVKASTAPHTIQI